MEVKLTTSFFVAAVGCSCAVADEMNDDERDVVVGGSLKLDGKIFVGFR